MRQGEFTLFQQVGGKGYYGKVRLECEPLDHPECIIKFDTCCSPEWRIGTEFGIMYGWELFRRSCPEIKGLSVRVLEIRGQFADTTNLVMAFVSANALWKALDWLPPKPPSLDPKTGTFTFSKY